MKRVKGSTIKNRVGIKYGRLTVIELNHSYGCDRYWKCICECGNTVIVRGNSLNNGSTRSCGCLGKSRAKGRLVKNILGNRYGRLLVTKENGRTKDNKVLWECLCDCGNIITARSCQLIGCRVSSCGCLQKEVIGEMKTIHGFAKNGKISEYKIWVGIKRRCYNEKIYHYKNYGGRGIRMSDEWLHSFETFFKDMGERPSKIHSIDRIDVNGNYCKENCRWATPKQQAANTRRCRNIEYDGIKMILNEWARFIGIRTATMYRIFSFKSDSDTIEFYIKKYNLYDKLEGLRAANGITAHTTSSGI